MLNFTYQFLPKKQQENSKTPTFWQDMINSLKSLYQLTQQINILSKIKTSKTDVVDISINVIKGAVTQNCKVKRSWLYALSVNSHLCVYPIWLVISLEQYWYHIRCHSNHWYDCKNIRFAAIDTPALHFETATRFILSDVIYFVPGFLKVHLDVHFHKWNTYISQSF